MTEHFTSHYLAEILRDFYFRESSGRLRIQGPKEATVDLFFDRGMFLFGEGSHPDDSFESRLEAAGVLPRSTLKKLNASRRSSIEKASGLIEKKVLDKESLAPVIRSLVDGAVHRAFSWISGTYEFDELRLDGGFFEPDVLFTFECILKGISGMGHFGPLKEVLLRLPGNVRMSEKVFLPVQQLTLRANHGYVLSRVDGSMRMEEICMLLPPGEEDESLQFLYGLAVLGIVEFDPPVGEGLFSLREIMLGHYETRARAEKESAMLRTAVERILGQTPAEIFGVAPDAEEQTIRASYERLKAQFSKDRLLPEVVKSHRKELTLIEKKLAEAFLGLQVKRLENAGHGTRAESTEIDTEVFGMRREMVKTQAQEAQENNARLAEKYLHKAREYHHEKDFHNCIQFCRLALRFGESNAAIYVLMADALSRNPTTKWQKMAEEAYEQACRLDPWNAEYHVALGKFYASHGMEHRARKKFEKALEIVPSHPEAKQAMASTSGRRR